MLEYSDTGEKDIGYGHFDKERDVTSHNTTVGSWIIRSGSHKGDLLSV